MKKTLSVICALVLLISVSVSVAEEDETVADIMITIRDFAKDRLDGMIKAYQETPDAFDSEYAEMTYKYFRLVVLLNEIVLIEQNYDIKQDVFSNGKGVRESIIHNGMNSEVDKLLSEKYDDGWRKFRNNEYTLNEFMEFVVKIYNIQFSELE